MNEMTLLAGIVFGIGVGVLISIVVSRRNVYVNDINQQMYDLIPRRVKIDNSIESYNPVTREYYHNQLSKECTELLQEVIDGPMHGPMTSEQVDELLGIDDSEENKP